MKILKITFITLALMSFVMSPLSYAKPDPGDREAIAELKDAYEAYKDEVKADTEEKRDSLKEATSDEERAITRAEIEDNKNVLKELKDATQDQIHEIRMSE
jgi:TRAP-type C4-dicarboxylate transport system substrate-binding protein